MTRPPTTRARLRVVTRAIPSVEDALAFADPHDPTVWARRGDVLVGIGTARELRVDHATGTDIASRWWADVVAAAEIDDEIGLPGSGLVAFGAFAFDAESDAPSVLRVPEVVVGRRGDTAWMTRIADAGSVADEGADAAHAESGGAETAPTATPFGPQWSATLGPGIQTPEGYEDAVREALRAIAVGEVSKVVLARDLVGTVPAGADLRRLVRALAAGYPDTWTYAVDGLIGASPETLVMAAGGTVTARVLAGTAARGADVDADTAAAVALATSAKDLDEHDYAVQSVLSSLRPYTRSLAAAEQPFTLRLPNVWHLATDVEGELAGAASVLDLVGALHPTAAVAGTPTTAALELIRRLEPFDRGRYAGPVGWVDADGDGEWAIALRCAQFETDAAGTAIPLVAHAGAGIVAGSDPEAEMLETRVKFHPIVDALA